MVFDVCTCIYILSLMFKKKIYIKNNLVPCGIDLLTCGNEFLTCGNVLLTRGYNFLVCGNEEEFYVHSWAPNVWEIKYTNKIDFIHTL